MNRESERQARHSFARVSLAHFVCVWVTTMLHMLRPVCGSEASFVYLAPDGFCKSQRSSDAKCLAQAAL
eukprot:2210855-Amphidinium_carterae.1